MLLWCGALWILTNALEMISTDVNAALFWNKIEYAAIAPIPILWLIMARQFTGTIQHLTYRRFFLLSIVPAICVVILMTNEYHGLFFSDFRFESDGSAAQLVFHAGPAMIVYYVQGYMVVLFGTYLLTEKLLRSPGFRWQGSAVLLGVALTVMGSIIDWTELSPVSQIKLAPLALAISVPLFVVNIIRVRRADLVPIARSQVIQTMPDAVVVLDVENRIVDMNPAAEIIVGHSLASVMGKTVEEAWPAWSIQVGRPKKEPSNRNELHLVLGDKQRIYDMRESKMQDWRGQVSGCLYVLRDVTERVEAESALKLSEEHYRALTENATDLVVIVDQAAIIRYASPSIERVFGYDLDEVISKNATAFVHPDDVSTVTVALANSLTNPGMSGPIIARFRRKDGSWHKLECVANNLLDHPAVGGIVINARDVTERVEAENRLRVSEEYFRALTENASDVTIITGMDGAIQYVSPSLERIFNRSREQIIGRSAMEFIHPDDANLILAAMANRFLGEDDKNSSGTFLARFHDSSGQWHLLECVWTNMLTHSAIQGVVVNARDVTERENMAQALRESEERYRLHFTNVNDVVYSFDSQLRVTSVSPSVKRILGYTPEELIGISLMNPDELALLKPEYFEKAATEAFRVLNGERIEGTLYEFIAKDGRCFTAEISASPIFRDGQVIGVVNVARDITERVQAEMLLRASLQEKEVLLKEIHHRVKNNMQIVASLLNLQSGKIASPEMRAHFEDSQNRIRSMALVHERLYRSEDLARIDFGEYVRDLSSHLMQGYRSQCKKVEIVIDVEPIQLDVDTAVPCGLIINELVSNALKHAFANGTEGIIKIEARREGVDAYCLSVRDNGVGMPSDIDLTRSKTLGLQLVSSLSKQLNGVVSLDTENGTRVALRFSTGSDHRSGSEAKMGT